MKPYLLVLFGQLASLLRFSHSVCAAELSPLDLGEIREEHVFIPMRDGTRLSAYLYFPPGKGPWPVIFEQRYAVITNNASRKEMASLAQHGFVAARASFRGAQLSEGKWRGYRSLAWGEQQDGYDLCEWFGTQPWSTGKVGTFGGSQGGFAQNFLAVTQPPHLVCQYMTDTGLSLFHEGYRIGGITRPERFKKMSEVARNPADNDALLVEWFQHPHYDDYWRAEDCTLHFRKMNVPCFSLGSWYDFMCVGSIQSFVGRQHRGGPRSRHQQQLLIGPWLHGGLPKSNKIGDLTFPQNAFFDTQEHMLRWFDHYLKGIANGIEKDPPVRYYVMGAVDESGAPGNVWRTAENWPVPSKETPYYLGADGQLGLRKPLDAQSRTTLQSDPLHPMEIPGTSFPGARDARGFERQAEVRTFSTAPLTEPVEWTGKVRADLVIASTAKDTDFIVRVSDVYPDGRSILIMDYPHRVRYRHGWDHEQLLKPGQPQRVTFDVGSLSQIFNRGHRIRVTIASTGAPLYEPNPQTGEPLTMDWPSKHESAVNTIYHSSQHSSRILAPIVHH